jgi:hypothetical protein
MREYTLIDCETGLIYGPYQSCAMARAGAEAEAIATWEIFTDGDKLVDWSRPEPNVRSDASLKDRITRKDKRMRKKGAKTCAA